MFIDAILGITFLGSLFFLWYRLSEKIPALVAVPDQVISDNFKEESAKVRLFILHLKTFYKEKHFREELLNFVYKILQRTHILLMKADNGLTRLLKSMRKADLEQEKKIAEPAALALARHRLRTTRIQEVRPNPARRIKKPRMKINAPVVKPTSLESAPIKESPAEKASDDNTLV